MEVDLIKRDLRKKKNKGTASRMCVLYLHGTSEVLARVLRPYGVVVAHKPVSTLGHFLPLPKDRPPKEKAQGLIYRIPCAECNASYVGETKNFPECLRRHKYDVKKNDIQGNALAEHAQKTGHVIGFDSSSILDRERNWRKRLLRESWHIRNTNNKPPERCQAATYTGYDAPRTKTEEEIDAKREEENNDRLLPLGPHIVTRDQGAEPASKRRAHRRNRLESIQSTLSYYLPNQAEFRQNVYF